MVNKELPKLREKLRAAIVEYESSLGALFPPLQKKKSEKSAYSVNCVYIVNLLGHLLLRKFQRKFS